VRIGLYITKYTSTLLLNLHHLFHPDELGAMLVLCMAEGFCEEVHAIVGSGDMQ